MNKDVILRSSEHFLRWPAEEKPASTITLLLKRYIAFFLSLLFLFEVP